MLNGDEYMDLDDDELAHDYGDYDDEVDDSPEQKSPTKQPTTKRSTKTSQAGRKDRPKSAASSNGSSSKYAPENVANQMLLRKDRKIPHSVFKAHAEEVVLLLSQVYGQSEQPRVVFTYPKYCLRNDQAPSFLSTENRILALENNPACPKNVQIIRMSQGDMKKGHMTLGFKMTETTHIYNSVVNSLKTAGCRIVGPASAKWNVMWTGVTRPEILKDMTRFQRVNHFPQSFHLGRKDLMWKNIYRMKKAFPRDFEICPTTYLLPDDYKKLAFDRESDKKNSLYILKPNAASCGKGISVLGPQDQIPKKGGYLVSKYIASPHLIEGLKYDLRIYVLVTSYDPLKVYLFREGLTRFATEKYSTNMSSLKKRFVHLTNYSVNKKNVEGYVRNQDKATAQQTGAASELSSKWNLLQLKTQFDKMGLDFKATKHRIKDVIIKTLISVEPHIVNTQSRSTKHRNVCFEIYGFDILLDSKLKPWLLEVNISPSLSSSSPLDKKIKTMLICDTLNLVGISAYDRKKLAKDQEAAIRNRLLGFSEKPAIFDQNAQRISQGGQADQAPNHLV